MNEKENLRKNFDNYRLKIEKMIELNSNKNNLDIMDE